MPKRWMKSCIKGVKKSGYADDPAAICAANWYHKMSEKNRHKVLREEEQKKREHKNK